MRTCFRHQFVLILGLFVSGGITPSASAQVRWTLAATDPLAKPVAEEIIPENDAANVLMNFLAGDTKKYAIPQDPQRIAAVRGARINWRLENTLDAFARHGNSKAPWANEVRAAMNAYSFAWARENSLGRGVYHDDFMAKLAAIDPACDDPLIQYWRYRHVPLKAGEKPDFAARKAIVKRLIDSNIYKTQMIHAAYNYRNDIKFYSRNDPQLTQRDIEEAEKLFEQAFAAILPLKHNLDWDNLYQIMVLNVSSLIKQGVPRLDAWKKIDDRLREANVPSWIRDTLEGKVLIDAAWDARGIGFANTVTPEAFALFRERLEKAKEKLEAAWNFDNRLDEPATLMLLVAKGLGFPREEMELWFKRAMEADPDNYTACCHKKDWLQPKWHGSRQDLLTFNKQCFDTKNYYSGIPQLYEITSGVTLPYSDEKVMAVATKEISVFLPFMLVANSHLAHYPDDRWCRTRFAYHAILWKQWDTALEQFEHLGENPYPGWFKNKEDYDAKRKLALEMKTGIRK